MFKNNFDTGFSFSWRHRCVAIRSSVVQMASVVYKREGSAKPIRSLQGATNLNELYKTL
jgi:hypothetical protein